MNQLYKIRYNEHCKWMNFHQATATLVIAASAKEAREFFMPKDAIKECKGNECTEELEHAHSPQITVLSVEKYRGDYPCCVGHVYLARNEKNSVYEPETELDPDLLEEIEFYQFPGYDSAAQAVYDLLPLSEMSWSDPSPEYVEELETGVKLDLDGIFHD